MSEEEDKYRMSDDGVLLATGLENAFIGIARRAGQKDVAVYSVQKAIQALIEQGIEEDSAREYLEFNSIGSWVGDITPVWLEEMDLVEFLELEPLVETEITLEMINAEGGIDTEVGAMRKSSQVH